MDSLEAIQMKLERLTRSESGKLGINRLQFKPS